MSLLGRHILLAPAGACVHEGPSSEACMSDDAISTDEQTSAAVARFNLAFGSYDIDAVMAAMTDDCVFESTSPPDGIRSAGQDAVRAAFTDFFAVSADSVFESEEQIVAGDRLVARWRYTWPATASGPSGHVRGVDLFRVRDGLVAEKLSYVKG
jgi:ketosteroid isomerase-like protein